MPPADSGEGVERKATSSSEVSGSASDVVQARDIQGGVHFHRPPGPLHQIPSQLPNDVGSFVNRLTELRLLNKVLDREGAEHPPIGLYVITGTAGVGKTSLALHWAHRVRHRFPDGQLYVNLRGYDPGIPMTAEQALFQFLRAFGVDSAAMPAALEDRSTMFRSFLADRRMLVILDNAATVAQVRPLLPGNARCLVIVTSRNRFSGLVARDGARRLLLDTLSEEEAVNLLHTVTANYRTSDNADDLAELARLCARLPLALRIAAERASSRPMMLLRELIDDLRDESALWEALTAEEDDESDAVRTVFAWSYRALPEAAARLFRLLGLHPGPDFSVPAAVAVSGTRSAATVRQLLDALIGAHVLEQHVPGRFQFHDLLRIYAAQQAFQQEDPVSRQTAVRRILEWYSGTLVNATSVIAPFDRRITPPATDSELAALTFPDRADAFEWYENERANLVAAVRTAAAAGEHRIAWQIPAALRSIYVSQNPFAEWIETGRTGLQAARDSDDAFGAAEMLDTLGKAYLQSQQLDLAEECHTEALRLRRQIDDRYGQGVSTNALGLLDWRHRRLAAARLRFGASLHIFRELGERRWQALTMTNLGMTHLDLLELSAADEILRESVSACQQIGDRAYEGNALLYRAMTQRELGDPDGAHSSISRALGIAEEDRHTAWEAFWLLELARIQRATGDPAGSLISYQRSAVIQRQLNDRNREALALDGTGESYRELDRADEAAKFHRMAVAMLRETGDRWSLAGALSNLALALTATGDRASAQPSQREAVQLLSSFGDPRAQRAISRLEEELR